MSRIDRDFVKNILPARDPNGHKGTFGKVLCVGGSVGYTGAPIFASRAAVRTGSGLVFLGVPESIWQVAAVKSDEAMPFPMPDDGGKLHRSAFGMIAAKAEGCDAVLYGCGLGRSEALDWVASQMLTIPRPLVLDADGINALAGHMDVSQRRSAVTVLTPHEGEFARIGGDLRRSRIDAAVDFAQAHGVYLVLKGPGTVVAAPDGRYAVNTTGNDGMAKGGSGDVLAGMLVSLLGQGMDAFDACCAAVYLHGLAGDLAAADKGKWGMTPTDLLEQIPYAIKETEQ